MKRNGLERNMESYPTIRDVFHYKKKYNLLHKKNSVVICSFPPNVQHNVSLFTLRDVLPFFLEHIYEDGCMYFCGVFPERALLYVSKGIFYFDKGKIYIYGYIKLSSNYIKLSNHESSEFQGYAKINIWDIYKNIYHARPYFIPEKEGVHEITFHSEAKIITIQDSKVSSSFPLQPCLLSSEMLEHFKEHSYLCAKNILLYPIICSRLMEQKEKKFQWEENNILIVTYKFCFQRQLDTLYCGIVLHIKHDIYKDTVINKHLFLKEKDTIVEVLENLNFRTPPEYTQNETI